MKARENIETLMVRGAKFDVGNTKCKVLDVREKGIELEMDVEMIGNENFLKISSIHMLNVGLFIL